MVRKPGKLPRATIKEEYALEYGTNELHMHEDSVKPGERVLCVDDLLATGGTMIAMCRLAQRAGAQVVKCAFVIDQHWLLEKEMSSLGCLQEGQHQLQGAATAAFFVTTLCEQR